MSVCLREAFAMHAIILILNLMCKIVCESVYVYNIFLLIYKLIFFVVEPSVLSTEQ